MSLLCWWNSILFLFIQRKGGDTLCGAISLGKRVAISLLTDTFIISRFAQVRGSAPCGQLLCLGVAQAARQGWPGFGFIRGSTGELPSFLEGTGPRFVLAVSWGLSAPRGHVAPHDLAAACLFPASEGQSRSGLPQVSPFFQSWF